MKRTRIAKKTAKERFEEKFVVLPSGCWQWTACFQGTGYGYFSLNSKLVTAQRAALELYKGIIAGDKYACHTCDNRWCVNPDHIFLGTAKDNLDDCRQKGRFTPGNHGKEHNGRAKLSNSDVAEIRRLASISTPRREILAKFPIKSSQYHRIVNNQHWPSTIEENS